MKTSNFDTHFANLVKINESLNAGAAEHYKKSGLTYVDVPEIVGITGACENVDTLFKVGSRLSLPLFFTQTGQLSLEQALQSFHGCFTVIHSGRDEEIEDERHLRQFRLTEEEFDCTFADMTRKTYDEEKMFDTLLNHIQKAIQAMIKRILIDNRDILRSHRDIKKLEYAARTDFLQISYSDAVKMVGIPFGHDLKADHEAKILKVLNSGNTELPVFITRYPKEIKFFNMKVSTRDPRVVLSADLIFPYAGEGTGSAVREHDFGKLKDRLLTSTMFRLHRERGGTYDDFGWYMDIIKNEKSNPHAGYGIGNERVLQYVFGESDIRHVSLFSLLNDQTGDWNREKYGQAAFHTEPTKHILITIGKLADKKRLLPSVASLSSHGNFILYATEHTYKFYKQHNIQSSLVYKVSQVGKQPNIAELLERRVFDLIINIPTRKNRLKRKELTDGKLMRKTAIELGITLITDIEVAEDMIRNLLGSKMKPFFDQTKSYDENYNHGPFGLFTQIPPKRVSVRKRTAFLGYNIDLPFGIPAGPLLNSRFIMAAWKWGFSLATYKTVRGNIYACHTFPNVIKVKIVGDVHQGDTLIGEKDGSSGDAVGITNSFGVPSQSPRVWQADVKRGLTEMKSGNLMILSFMGTKKEGMTFEEYVSDFAKTALLAKETGAPVLEVNFSCPNVGKEGLICNDVATSHAILEAIKPIRGNTPLLVKIGYFPGGQRGTLESLLDAIYETANGVVAINTIQAKVTDKEGKQILPGSPVRLMSGICGAAIRWAGLEMVERIVAYKKRKGWKDFVVIGVGGVTTPEDYKRYMSLGVDAVQSATGAMWNPRLALEVRKSER